MKNQKRKPYIMSENEEGGNKELKEATRLD